MALLICAGSHTSDATRATSTGSGARRCATAFGSASRRQVGRAFDSRAWPSDTTKAANTHSWATAQQIFSACGLQVCSASNWL